VTAFYVGIYVLVALLVGLCGRHRRMGFVGILVLALLITPPIALLLLYLMQETPPPISPARR